MKNKYISFARCSTKKSADGHSPADQHAKNKEFIASRGGECIREFTLAISGKKMEVHEGALKNILRIAKEENADVVVDECCFSTPLICIQRCCASITTATPFGLSVS